MAIRFAIDPFLWKPEFLFGNEKLADLNYLSRMVSKLRISLRYSRRNSTKLISREKHSAMGKAHHTAVT